MRHMRNIAIVWLIGSLACATSASSADLAASDLPNVVELTQSKAADYIEKYVNKRVKIPDVVIFLVEDGRGLVIFAGRKMSIDLYGVSWNVLVDLYTSCKGPPKPNPYCRFTIEADVRSLGTETLDLTNVRLSWDNEFLHLARRPDGSFIMP